MCQWLTRTEKPTLRHRSLTFDNITSDILTFFSVARLMFYQINKI